MTEVRIQASATTIELVRPDERYQDSFLRAVREFREEGLSWWFGGDLDLIDRSIAAFIEKKLSDANPASGALVPKTHLWAISAGDFVGRISIHHELTDALRTMGGHIGYDTVPAFRGRGIATEMLRLALPLARSLGLVEVLLTCDETNVASIRVIERNGGLLRDTKSVDPKRPPKRYYWIPLL